MTRSIRSVRLRHIFVSLVFASITACGYQGGTFGPEVFHHSGYGYDVRYSDPVMRQIMPADWQLDNYKSTSSGLEAKDTGYYLSTFEFDTDKDRVLDTAENLPTFDLRFVNPKMGAVVWLRTIPAPAYETERNVYALAKYVDGIAMGGPELARFGEQVTNERVYAVQILETKTAKLAKVDALTVTIQIAKLSELKASPDAKRTAVRLVLLRTGNTRRVPATDWEYATIMVAGYSSPIEVFEKKLADFNAFLGQIVLHGESGYKELTPAAT